MTLLKMTEQINFLEQPNRLTCLQLPSVFNIDEKIDRLNNKQSFQTFIFKDNFTKNKILLKDLSLKKSINLNEERNKKPEQFSSNHKKRLGYRNNIYEISDELRQLTTNINLLKNTKNFQVSSLKYRDTKYHLSLYENDYLKKINEIKQKKKLRKSKMFQSNFRQSKRIFLKKNLIELESNQNNRPHLRQMNASSHRMRDSTKLKFSYLQQKFMNHHKQSNLNQKQQQEVSEKIIIDEKQNQQQWVDLKNQSDKFEKKMKFYLKRTLIQNGQYLIKPTLPEFKRINLLKCNKTVKYKEQSVALQNNLINERITEQLKNHELQQITTLKDNKLNLKIVKQNIVKSTQQKQFLNALKKDDKFEIMYLLQKNPELINIKDEKRNNPLHYAAKIGNLQTFQYLLQKGINLNEKNNFNQTPLDICKHFGYHKICQYFRLNIKKLNTQ